MKVPLTNPALNEEIKDNLLNAINSKVFLQKEAVDEFEKEFAEYVGARFAIAVNSGTTALMLALRGLNIGKGDKIITTSSTFVSTANAAILAGAEPVFTDIDNKDCNMDVMQVRKLLNKFGDTVKAVIPVHLYGYPCDMDSLIQFANTYNVKILEDACQAHGGEYSGKKLGSVGDIGVFSFHPLKILSVFGDGGMITVDSREIADQCRELRDCGASKKDPYMIDHISFPARLNTINAIIGKTQLKYLDSWNKNREKIAQIYLNELNDVGDLKLPPDGDSTRKRVWYLFSIRTKYRDKLKAFLESRNITCGMYYKIPVHLQPPYLKLGYKRNMYPNAEKLGEEVLNIPLYSQMSENEAGYVIESIKRFFMDRV